MQKETRNICNYYHYWLHSEIISDLDAKRHNFSVFCVNIHHDFNLGSIVRNCNAFLAKQIFIYGNKRFDRRGCVGTNHYEKIVHLPIDTDLETFFKQFYTVGIDNVENSKSIETYEWQADKHVLMLFGEEQLGISKDILDMCNDIIFIRMQGSIRSLNVGCASAIAMYDYCRKVVK